MKDNLDGKIMTKCFNWSAKTCTYLTDDDSKHKKTKGTKKCVMKEKLNLKIIKTVLKQLNLKIE